MGSFWGSRRFFSTVMPCSVLSWRRRVGPDEHNRVMLQDWELGLAVNHALSYIRPDETLRQAIVEGRMRTRQDVEREVARMLNDGQYSEAARVAIFPRLF